MSQPFPVALIIALLLLTFSALPASAVQESVAHVNVNTYVCPADYDQVSNCEKIGGVVVRVEADGTLADEVTTLVDSGAEVEVPVGATVTVSVVGGQPEGTTLEDASMTFTAVEGQNAMTLIFLQPGDTTDVDTDGDALTDEQEAAVGMDPNDPDTDSDGVQDGAEVNVVGTDPLVADTDGDGFTDGEELDRQTDPLDPNSFPVDTEPNSIAITAFTCQVGYEGKNVITDCTTPAAGVDFVVYIPGSEWGERQTTDANGKVFFDNLGSGTFVFAEDLSTVGIELQRYTAFCFGDPVAPDAPEPRQVVYEDLGNGEYAIELTSGEEISCTWYNIPAGDDGQATSTVTPTSTPALVTQLPDTGSGDAADDPAQPTMSLFIGAASLMMLAAAVMMRRRIA